MNTGKLNSADSLLNEVIILIQSIENKLEQHKLDQSKEIVELYLLLEKLQNKIDQLIQDKKQQGLLHFLRNIF